MFVAATGVAGGVGASGSGGEAGAGKPTGAAGGVVDGTVGSGP
jgi:hypothetical protein